MVRPSSLVGGGRARASRPSRLACGFLAAVGVLCVLVVAYSGYFFFSVSSPSPNPTGSSTSTSGLIQMMATLSEPRTSPNAFTVAYCVYPQKMRSGEPVLGGEWMARELGARMFADGVVAFVTCLAVPDQLPSGVPASSPEGLRLLGMRGVHVRFCSWGSSSVVRVFEQVAGVSTGRVAPSFNISERAPNVNVPHVKGPEVLRVKRQSEDGEDTYQTAGAMLIRSNREAWPEHVPGVAVQFDTKVLFSDASLGMHMPYAYEIFGRARWNGGPARKGKDIEKHDQYLGKSLYSNIREMVTRPKGFDAKRVREAKDGFMAMINSNCGKSIRTAAIRGLFGYAVFHFLKKPVHNLGSCPRNPAGAVRAGLSLKERKALHDKWAPSQYSATASVEDLFNHYKFAIVFENNNVEGYATEKMTSAYVGQAVPVYWGSGSLVHEIFNAKAFVNCHLPAEITNIMKDPALYEQVRAECTARGGGQPQAATICTDEETNDVIYEKLLPHFEVCTRRVRELDENNDLYEAMLREPLGTLDESGELTGVWNTTQYAVGLRAAFDALNYKEAPAALERTLNLQMTS